MLLRAHTRRLAGFIEPCLPRPADQPPAGAGWVHEIKHDGFRIIATRAGETVRLFSRRGSDLTTRFRAAVAAIAALKPRSFVIDGEAIAVDQNGLAVFELLRSRRHDHVPCSVPSMGPADSWVKVKNPAAPAVTREAEEEWN